MDERERGWVWGNGWGMGYGEIGRKSGKPVNVTAIGSEEITRVLKRERDRKLNRAQERLGFVDGRDWTKGSLPPKKLPRSPERSELVMS
jgi:hypothetical protein